MVITRFFLDWLLKNNFKVVHARACNIIEVLLNHSKLGIADLHANTFVDRLDYPLVFLLDCLVDRGVLADVWSTFALG